MIKEGLSVMLLQRPGFSETLQCNHKNEFKSKSQKVLELGAIRHPRVGRFLSTVWQGAVFFLGASVGLLQ